jgi:hypothetical protein
MVDVGDFCRHDFLIFPICHGKPQYSVHDDDPLGSAGLGLGGPWSNDRKILDLTLWLGPDEKMEPLLRRFRKHKGLVHEGGWGSFPA